MSNPTAAAAAAAAAVVTVDQLSAELSRVLSLPGNKPAEVELAAAEAKDVSDPIFLDLAQQVTVSRTSMPQETAIQGIFACTVRYKGHLANDGPLHTNEYVEVVQSSAGNHGIDINTVTAGPFYITPIGASAVQNTRYYCVLPAETGLVALTNNVTIGYTLGLSAADHPLAAHIVGGTILKKGACQALDACASEVTFEMELSRGTSVIIPRGTPFYFFVSPERARDTRADYIVASYFFNAPEVTGETGWPKNTLIDTRTVTGKLLGSTLLKISEAPVPTAPEAAEKPTKKRPAAAAPSASGGGGGGPGAIARHDALLARIATLKAHPGGSAFPPKAGTQDKTDELRQTIGLTSSAKDVKKFTGALDTLEKAVQECEAAAVPGGPLDKVLARYAEAISLYVEAGMVLPADHKQFGARTKERVSIDSLPSLIGKEKVIEDFYVKCAKTKEAADKKSEATGKKRAKKSEAVAPAPAAAGPIYAKDTTQLQELVYKAKSIIDAPPSTANDAFMRELTAEFDRIEDECNALADRGEDPAPKVDISRLHRLCQANGDSGAVQKKKKKAAAAAVAAEIMCSKSIGCDKPVSALYKDTTVCADCFKKNLLERYRDIQTLDARLEKNGPAEVDEEYNADGGIAEKLQAEATRIFKGAGPGADPAELSRLITEAEGFFEKHGIIKKKTKATATAVKRSRSSEDGDDVNMDDGDDDDDDDEDDMNSEEKAAFVNDDDPMSYDTSYSGGEEEEEESNSDDDDNEEEEGSSKRLKKKTKGDASAATHVYEYAHRILEAERAFVYPVKSINECKAWYANPTPDKLHFIDAELKKLQQPDLILYGFTVAYPGAKTDQLRQPREWPELYTSEAERDGKAAQLERQQSGIVTVEPFQRLATNGEKK
jgi:hypothetical protein